jgi:glutaconate CoA-transferase, subunit B
MMTSTGVNSIERLVILMAREVKNDDVAVVGIGTPVALAALLLARTLQAPNVTILMPGAMNPGPRDIAEYLSDPTRATSDATSRLSRLQILDAISSGSVTLQYVRPAQVDGRFRINTELLRQPNGDLHLVGPVALPDIVHLVGRVIAYLPRHDTLSLVAEVDTITAPRPPDARGVTRVVTPIAVLEQREGGPGFVAIARELDELEVRRRTGFALDPKTALRFDEPDALELETLRTVVDPKGLIGLEDSSFSAQAVQTLAALWDSATAATHTTQEVT